MVTKKYFLISLYFFALLTVGYLIFPDYGISLDEDNTRISGFVSLKYIFEILFPHLVNEIDKFTNIPSMTEWNEQGIGVIFDLPAAFLELIFNINDTRQYYLLRHFLNYLIFFFSVYFFFLIIKKRYESNYMAFLGSFFLILSPRIFADSFYNNKDLIFLSLFIISLYYALKFLENANIKNTILFSLTSSLATDIRILGIILPILIIFFYLIKNFKFKNNKIKVLNPILLLLVLTPFFITLFWPYLWNDPLNNFITIFKSLSHFDENIYNFYFGEYIDAKNIPWHYPIVWLGITTPLLYIILFIIGFVFTIKKIYKNLLKIEQNEYNNFWKNKKDMQDFVFFTIFLIPLVIVIYLNSTLYDGWRHLYFIYPIFLLISLLGLHIIRITFFRKKLNILLVLIICLLSPTFIWMIKNHPHQFIYFNLLAGKNFNDNFEMDYWGLSNAKALEYIAKNESGIVNVGSLGTTDLNLSKNFLLKKYRDKMIIASEISNSQYLINSYRDWHGKKISVPANYEILYEIKIDEIPINTIYKKIK
jgi:hypothetical protein